MTDPIKKRKKKKHNKKKRMINISSALLKTLLGQNNSYKNPMYNPQGITYYGGLSGGSIPINNSVLNKPAYEFGSLYDRLARPAILPPPEPMEPVKPTKKLSSLSEGLRGYTKDEMKILAHESGLRAKSNATKEQIAGAILTHGMPKFKNPEKQHNEPKTDIFSDPIQTESRPAFHTRNRSTSFDSNDSDYYDYTPGSPSKTRNNLKQALDESKKIFVQPKKNMTPIETTTPKQPTSAPAKIPDTGSDVPFRAKVKGRPVGSKNKSKETPI
jgi:hypothetical protein